MTKLDFAIDCLKRIREAGFEAYFAGGCVRDHLMGNEAIDYDIATSALPVELEALFPRTVLVGEAFNVLILLSEHPQKPYQVEAATFRKDLGIKDGRRPERVERATAQEDVQRRDFSINGMLWDPLSNEVHDWVGGQKDLAAKMIRAIGEPEARLKEDYLRMLRAVRFSARFDFKIEKKLEQAIQQLAPQIHQISKERIFDECCRMLSRQGADRAIEQLDDLNLLSEILPELLLMKGVEQPPEYHPEGDVWVHTLLLLKQIREGHSPELGWACLLHDIAKPQTFSHAEGDRIRFNGHASLGAEMSDQILRRLKAPNRFREIVHALVRDHLKFADVKKMRPSTLKRFLRQEHFDWHLELHRIDCLASHQNLDLYHFCQAALSELKVEDLRPPALISGQDLIAMGFSPGPKFKEILTEVESLQLDGQLKTKDEALDFVERNFALKT
ncbi:MAG: CCA tRNA nucleotidyltransferase [Bradymonadales bacterium]|nr:MAG: CCA tRNA nucleotidyltransferase [Bradymonadales bacterium]